MGSRLLIRQRYLQALVASASSISASSPALPSTSRGWVCEVGVSGAEGEGRRTAHVENSFAMPRSCSFFFPPIVKWH